MIALKVDGLTKTYPSFKLNNVSFEVEQGSIMGFIGKNGAGKSTTIKTMLNMVHADSGNVYIGGVNFRENESECKKNLGLVLGGVDFYPKKKIKVITKTFKTFFPDTWDDEKYKKYLSFFEIDENKRVDELSSGMKVKYMITLSLSHDAKLLVFDEPTSGLDPVARDDLCNLFLSLVKNGERSIFFSTHITSDLEKCASHITFIKDGEIQKSLPEAEFIREYEKELDFGGKTPTLENIIVKVERREYNDKVFD